MCPSPLIIRFFSLKTRKNWEGTSYQMVRLVCRHFAADERFARQYRHEPLPEFPLTLPFSGIFQGFSACGSYSKHSQDHGQWQVCCVCCACVVVYCGKTLKTRGNREKCVWYGVCAVWCCEVRKYTKNTRNIGNIVKTWSPFWARRDHPRTEKRSKLAIFPNALFLRFPWDLPTILARGPNPNAQKRRFLPKVLIQRKVLIMRWKKS